MTNVVIFNHPSVPQTENGLTGSGAIEMAKWSDLTAIVGLYLDRDNNWRLHTGAHSGGFRGYAQRQGERWTVEVWCASQKGYRQPPITYSSEALALRGLTRMAKWIVA